MLTRLVNQNYYIRIGKRFEKVKGMPISISATDLELFLHRSGNRIAISEASSGVKISANHKSKSAALKFVEIIFEKKGEALVKKNIKRHIGKDMLSPRYKFIINPDRKCGNLEE